MLTTAPERVAWPSYEFAPSRTFLDPSKNFVSVMLSSTPLESSGSRRLSRTGKSLATSSTIEPLVCRRTSNGRSSTGPRRRTLMLGILKKTHSTTSSFGQKRLQEEVCRAIPPNSLFISTKSANRNISRRARNRQHHRRSQSRGSTSSLASCRHPCPVLHHSAVARQSSRGSRRSFGAGKANREGSSVKFGA